MQKKTITISMRRNWKALAAAAAAVLIVSGGAAGYAVAITEHPTPPAVTGSAPGTLAGQTQPNQSMMGSFRPGQAFDVQFLDQMTMHHEGAVMSTRNMIANSSRPELRQLANDIITNQTSQIGQMRTWRQQWYPNVPDAFSGMTGPGGSMMGSGSMMGGSSMMGGGVDVMYLRMMIAHHQLAVDMAQQALQRGEHPELKQLARTIAAEQSAQINQMRGYLAALS